MNEEYPETLAAKKSLGQNFLTSNVVPSWMCDAGEITNTDTVLEIGPGTGALTEEILKRGSTVVALETDRRAVSLLEERFKEAIKAGQLQLISGDAREISIESLDLPSKYKVVANIPYYLSGFLLRLFLESAHQPETLVFLMQKEVVERITRDPKSSLLSLSVKVFGEPKYVKTVGRGHFSPQPKVDSAILLIRNIHRSFASPEAERHFFDMLHLGFGKKRKQLIANLSSLYERDQLESIFHELGLALTARAEELDTPTWQQLADRLYT